MTAHQAKDLRRVIDAALEVFTPEGVAWWMDAPSTLLGGATPHQAIRSGHADQVLAILAGLADGVMG